VEVETAEGRIGYGPVAVSDIGGLFDAGFIDAARTPAGSASRRSTFLRRQNRLTFARCGIIDPVSLSDTLRMRLARALRAIEIGPAATIAEVTKSGLRGRGGAVSQQALNGRRGGRASRSPLRGLQFRRSDSGTFADR